MLVFYIFVCNVWLYLKMPNKLECPPLLKDCLRFFYYTGFYR